MGRDLTASASNPSLIVECIGVPGVGKSTLSHRVAAILRHAGIPCAEPTYEIDHAMTPRRRIALKIQFAVIGALRRPSQVAAWVSAILASGQRSVREAGAVTLNWCYLVEVVHRAARAPGVHILDQGLFQAWWSLQYGAQSGRPLSSDLAGRLFPPSADSTLVVALDASVATALARLRGRGGQGSRVDRDMAGGRSAEPAMRASEIFDQLVECVRGLETEPALRVLRVTNDGEGGVDEIAQFVARDIAERYIRGGGDCPAGAVDALAPATFGAALRLV